MTVRPRRQKSVGLTVEHHFDVVARGASSEVVSQAVFRQQPWLPTFAGIQLAFAAGLSVVFWRWWPGR